MREEAKDYSPFDDDVDENERGHGFSRGATSSKWFRYFLIAAAVFLTLAIVSSVVSNNSAGNRDVEDLAYWANRIFMALMLIACGGLLAVVRGPKIMAALQSSSTPGRPLQWSPWFKLFAFSIGSLVACGLFFVVLAVMFQTYGLALFALAIPTLIAMLITVAVFFQHEVRAYAIGVATTLSLGVSMFAGTSMLGLFWSPYGMNYNNSSMSDINFRLAFTYLTVLGISVFNGMLCAAIVTLKRRFAAEKAPVDNKPTQPIQATVLPPQLPPQPPIS
jgi:drug/metabolite transporter (DMT)-like permease